MEKQSVLPTFPVGAVEVIIEAQELLAGQRKQLTSNDEYVALRRRYWQMQAQRPRRHRAALPRTRVA
jgi:hypothetical protein